jgi:mRNA interferase MazF
MIMTTPSPPSTDKVKRGDVVLLPFPNSDLQTAKLRPALIVQSDDLDTGLSQIILAMVSSNLARVGHPSRILLKIDTEQGKESGLLLDSVIMTDNLATISLSRIVRIIGYIETNGSS